jgi:hypothetical protein
MQLWYLPGKNIYLCEANGVVVPKGHLHVSDPKIHIVGYVRGVNGWAFNSEPK